MCLTIVEVDVLASVEVTTQIPWLGHTPLVGNILRRQFVAYEACGLLLSIVADPILWQKPSCHIETYMPDSAASAINGSTCFIAGPGLAAESAYCHLSAFRLIELIAQALCCDASEPIEWHCQCSSAM